MHIRPMNYTEHLSKDRRLKKLVEQGKPFSLAVKKNIFLHLCGSIMSQQLSTRVAAVIHKRFVDLYGGEPTPQQVLDTPIETLRGIGLSNAKAQYVQNVAKFAIENGMEVKKLQAMSNDELSAHFTRIKGVGKWTTEMLMMFALGREDVFSADDLGIQNAMAAIYRLKKDDRKAFREKIIRISERWSPYRTYACLHLWHYKDNTPIIQREKRQRK
jgi:DNA-3-methyladenine glycosylase II